MDGAHYFYVISESDNDNEKKTKKKYLLPSNTSSSYNT